MEWCLLMVVIILAVAGGETVNFINGDNIAITNTGHVILPLVLRKTYPSTK